MSALAQKADTIVFNSANTKEFVTVYVADQSLGIEVKSIQDVFSLHDLTPVPGAPKEIAGVLNLRGRIVTAIDARVRLGLPPREEGYANIMAVGVESKGDDYCILVDKVGEVLRLEDTNFEVNPLNMDPNWKIFSKGIYRLDGKLLMSLDIEAMLGTIELGVAT
jgi:purine-binding chemotaxis protein CheW